MRKFIIYLFFSSLLLVSCSSNFNDTDLVGTWESVSSQQKMFTNGELTSTDEFIQPTATFNSDKTGLFFNKAGYSSQFTWSLSNNLITIVGTSMMVGQWQITELDDDVLVIKNIKEEQFTDGTITGVTKWVTVSRFIK